MIVNPLWMLLIMTTPLVADDPAVVPDPLKTVSGKTIVTKEQWEQFRRPEVLELFESQVYGKVPPSANPSSLSKAYKLEYDQLDYSDIALEGLAIRKQIRIHVTVQDRTLHADLLIYLPSNANQPVPVFLGLNFYGNHTIDDDPEILLNQNWMRNNKEKHTENNRATEQSRGTSKSRWPVRKILERGYGVACMYYGDWDPDYHDEFRNGIHGLFDPAGNQRNDESWGAIAGWAWGLSRAMDYVETDKDVDQKHVAVFGHSRLGKTALWTGATDERFAMAISNNSGCGGAANFRRKQGETVTVINKNFPHWFCKNFHSFDDRENDLPIDQHLLIALSAPRPVYVASASEDLWADPEGEFLSIKGASAVYRLYGKKGIESQSFPKAGKWFHQATGYHLREGKHNVTDWDWDRYLDFADAQFVN